MVADPRPIRYFVDESLMGLAKALPILRPDVTGCGHPRGAHGIVAGTKDLDWISVIAERGWITIGRDAKLRTRPEEAVAVRSARLRIVRLGGRRDLSSWGYASLLVRRWDDIEEFSTANPDGPWFLRVTSSGVRHMVIS